MEEILKQLKAKMDVSLDVLKKEFASLRTGRAQVSLLDAIEVEAYGSRMPLSQAGTVAAPDPKMLSIQVWDKGLIKAVEKAILDSGLGINPVVDGQLIRLPIPSLSEERRKELSKLASKYAEQSKVSVRNIRRDGMDQCKDLEKKSEISEDESRRFSEKIQELTDQSIKKIDELYQHKEKEVMTI